MKRAILIALITLVLMACGGTQLPPTPTSTPRSTPTPTAIQLPTPTDVPESSGIPWTEAASYVGQYATVCGPVVAASYRPDINGGPTWLNVGRDFPDRNRFQVVIWDDDRGNFLQPPESYYQGRFICITGTIELYQGVAEMIISSPAAISLQ